MSDEVENDHVPLAFLLGRRASEYRLPSLQRPVPLTQSRSSSSIFRDGLHLREREQQAQALLRRVLAKENRLDVTRIGNVDAALEPQRVQISTADRRQRTVELEKWLADSNQGSITSASSTTPASKLIPIHTSLSDESEEASRWQRECLGQTHGYVLENPSFVEVVGSHARVMRTESMREVHEDDVRRRKRQQRAKLGRMVEMHRRLEEQQRETKSKLLVVAMQRAAGQERAATKEGVDAKRRIAKHWQQEQQEELDKVKAVEREAAQKRHDEVQRARREAEAARKAKLSLHAKEKKTFAKIKSVSPSFVATLHIDSTATSNENNSSTPIGDPEDINEVDPGSPCISDEEHRENLVCLKLQARQHALFVQSHPRLLHLGGGFASKPAALNEIESIRQVTTNTLATEACGITVQKSRREVIAQWKTSVATYHGRHHTIYSGLS